METTLSPPLFFFPTRWATSSSLGKCDSPPSPLRLLRPPLRWRVRRGTRKSERFPLRQERERFPERTKRENKGLSPSLSFPLSRNRDREGEKKVTGRSHFPSRSTVARMLQRNAVFLPSSVPLRTGLSTHTHPHASALCSPKTAAAAMNEPKRAKLGSSRNAIDPTSASTCAAAAAASLTGDGGAAAARSAASAAPPSSRPAPVCLSHEIVDSFNVPGESE